MGGDATMYFCCHCEGRTWELFNFGGSFFFSSQFQDLLREHNVSAFDAWDTVKPKLEADSRFQLLASEKERRNAFIRSVREDVDVPSSAIYCALPNPILIFLFHSLSYQEKKVDEDKKARTETVKTVRESYHALLVEASVTPETTWPSVRPKI